MIGIVLRIGVFDDEVDTLNTEIVGSVTLEGTTPGEVHFFALGGVNFTQVLVGNFLTLHRGDIVDDGKELLNFLARQLI